MVKYKNLVILVGVVLLIGFSQVQSSEKLSHDWEMLVAEFLQDMHFSSPSSKIDKYIASAAVTAVVTTLYIPYQLVLLAQEIDLRMQAAAEMSYTNGLVAKSYTYQTASQLFKITTALIVSAGLYKVGPRLGAAGAVMGLGIHAVADIRDSIRYSPTTVVESKEL